jgi:hypothetical protein
MNSFLGSPAKHGWSRSSLVTCRSAYRIDSKMYPNEQFCAA